MPYGILGLYKGAKCLHFLFDELFFPKEMYKSCISHFYCLHTFNWYKTVPFADICFHACRSSFTGRCLHVHGCVYVCFVCYMSGECFLFQFMTLCVFKRNLCQIMCLKHCVHMPGMFSNESMYRICATRGNLHILPYITVDQLPVIQQVQCMVDVMAHPFMLYNVTPYL